MSFFDGNAPEMPEHRPVDDGEIEAALVGSTRSTGPDSLSAFVSAVRSVVEAVPTPSTAMAAVLAAGLSTEKGDLSATAASNVDGPASQEAGLPKWRKALMKIQGFLAGLGVVGKIALGVGVAAAATTGAGAVGVLPFSVPGVGHLHRHTVAVHSDTTTTSTPKLHLRPAAAHRSGTGHHTVAAEPHETVTPPTTTKLTTPTTVYDPPPTPTTVEVTKPTPTTTPTTDTTPTRGDDPTTTTTVHEPPSTTTTTTTSGEAPSQSIQLSCQVSGPQQVTCTWTASPTPVAKYALWRWTTGGTGSDYGPIDQTADGLTFVVNDVTPGVRYTYRVFTTLGAGTSGPFSNKYSMDPVT